MFNKISIIALALGLTSSGVFAAPATEAPTNDLVSRSSKGYWEVKNECDFKIYYTSVNQQGIVKTGYVNPHTTTLGSYASDENGLSVKMCKNQGCGNPYQFETTVSMKNGRVYYDLSAVDGDPFINYKRGVYPSDGSGPNYECAPGSESCAFKNPTDGPVGSASFDAVIIMQMC